MTIASTLGTATGNTAAYAKHGVLMSGIGGVNFVTEYIAATHAAYVAKDAELARRREAARQRAMNAPVDIVPRMTMPQD